MLVRYVTLDLAELDRKKTRKCVAKQKVCHHCVLKIIVSW